MRRGQVGLAAWLVGLAVAELICTVVVWRFFVRTEHGQLLDTVALAGNSVGRARIENLVNTVLNAMSVIAIVVATAIVGFIALAQRRIAVAVGAVTLIVGSAGSAYLLKSSIHRPDLGIDPDRAAAGNSLPSGHTAVAAAVAVALVLVLPSRFRGVGAVLAALAAGAVGAATLSAGWHRPSDAIAAILLVGVWAALVGLFIMVVQQDARESVPTMPGPNRIAIIALTVLGVGMLAAALMAMRLTDQVLTTPTNEIGRRRLFAAYAGGAAGITGTACIVMAAVLATAHRVIPSSLTGEAVGTNAPAGRRLRA
jgi:membrane-associated phospholipid phosphatase